MNTFADVKASRIPLSAGILPSDPRLIGLVNEAQDRLILKGRWWTTIQKIKLCVTEGCIAWPGRVQNVEQVAVCGVPIQMRNQWYEFVPGLGNIQQCDSCRSCGGDWGDASPLNLSCGHLAWYDRGTASTAQSIRGPNKKIRVYLSNLTDVGKRILFQGIDDNNLEIWNTEDGVTISGEYITLANPSVTSVSKFSAITGVQKAETNGIVWVYEVDATTGVQRFLSVYDPDEPNPSYRRSFIPGMTNLRCGNSCENSNTKTVTALVKLNFVPVKRDTDWLTINCLPAIKEMIASILKREKDQIQEAENASEKAVQILNEQLFAYTGGRTTIWAQGQPAGSARRLQIL